MKQLIKTQLQRKEGYTMYASKRGEVVGGLLFSNQPQEFVYIHFLAIKRTEQRQVLGERVTVSVLLKKWVNVQVDTVVSKS